MNRPPTDLDDAALLAIYCDGTDIVQRDEAFALLVARHGAMVAATCRRWLSGSEAEDAAQAVFVVLARKASEIRVGAALPGWLHQTAWNIAQRAASAVKARRIHETRAAQEAAAMPSHTAAPMQQHGDLDAALVRLPDTYRTPLVLHYFEGLPQAAVAQRLGLRENTVAMRLSRGRAMLREHLERLGAPAAALGLFLAVAPALSSAESMGLGQISAAVRNDTVSGRVEDLAAGAASTAVGGVALLLGALALAALAVGAWLLIPTAAGPAPVASAPTTVPGAWEAQLSMRPNDVVHDPDGRVCVATHRRIQVFAPDGAIVIDQPQESWQALGFIGTEILLGGRSGPDAVLRAVDASTGAEVWRRTWPMAPTSFGSPLFSVLAPWSPEGSIVALVMTGHETAPLLHLGSDGREIWSQLLTSESRGSLVSGPGGTFWCVFNDGRIDRRSADGSLQWSTTLGGNTSQSGPLSDGSLVVNFYTPGARHPQWTRLGPDGDVRWLQPFAFAASAIAEHPAGIIYAGTQLLDIRAGDPVQGLCGLLDADDGSQRWQRGLPGQPTGLRVHAEGLATVASGGSLTCFDPNGKLLAEREVDSNGPLLADRYGRTILLVTPPDRGENSRLIVLADGWWREPQRTRNF